MHTPHRINTAWLSVTGVWRIHGGVYMYLPLFTAASLVPGAYGCCLVVVARYLSDISCTDSRLWLFIMDVSIEPLAV